MYIYNIGYDSYEETEYVQLYHKNKYKNKEFEEMIMKAVVNVLSKQKIKKSEIISFQDIFSDLIEELIKNFGFKKVKFDSKFNVFGWTNILDKEDWKNIRDEKLNKLTDYIKSRKKNN